MYIIMCHYKAFNVTLKPVWVILNSIHYDIQMTNDSLIHEGDI
jgi:hypothetical protein